MNYKFRRYLKSDLEKLSEFNLSEYYIKKYSGKTILFRVLGFFKLYKSYFFVLTDQMDELIGHIVIRQRISRHSMKKFWWIYGVYISDKWRGRKIGKKIMIDSIEFLKNESAESVYLYVNKQNKVAVNLYEKLGFKIIMNSKYHNIKKSDFLMKLEIVDEGDSCSR